MVELLPATSLNCAVIDLVPSAAEVAGGYAQADAAGGDVRRGNGVGHRMGQRRTAQQQLHGIAGRHRRIERDGKTRRRHVGDAVGMRGAGIRCRRENRRAAVGAVVSRVWSVPRWSSCCQSRIAELRHNLLAAVGPEVAGGYAQADAAGGDVRRGDGVGHRMGQGRTASSNCTVSPATTVD